MLKLNVEKLVKEMNVAKDRIDYLFQDQIELRTNVKKFKKDYTKMKIENENFKQKLAALEKNYGVYFDAYRYDNLIYAPQSVKIIMNIARHLVCEKNFSTLIKGTKNTRLKVT